MTSFLVRAEPVDSPEAVALLRAYLAEMISRYWNRAATEAEIDDEIANDPSDDLRRPDGTFLVLREASDALGCVGLRPCAPGVVELKRMFVRPEARKRGGGRRLVTSAEESARDLGAAAIRLDTRADLVESRTLYAACGFVEIPAYNHGPHAEHWFEKSLEPSKESRRGGW